MSVSSFSAIAPDTSNVKRTLTHVPCGIVPCGEPCKHPNAPKSFEPKSAIPFEPPCITSIKLVLVGIW